MKMNTHYNRKLLFELLGGEGVLECKHSYNKEKLSRTKNENPRNEAPNKELK